MSDLTAGYLPSRIFQSTGLMLAAFTLSRISFGPGAGIGRLRYFITSREPNESILTTSIMVMRHSWYMLKFSGARGPTQRKASSITLASEIDATTWLAVTTVP